MKGIRFAMMLLALLLAGVCQAAQPDAVSDLRNQVIGKVRLFEVHVQSDKLLAIDDAAAGQKALDALLKPALDAAEGRPELAAAIKAFYVSAKTYFDSVDTPTSAPQYDRWTNNVYESPDAAQLRANQAKLKLDVESKANAMLLEARLVGLAAG